jgi:hypothetical protein
VPEPRRERLVRQVKELLEPEPSPVPRRS